MNETNYFGANTLNILDLCGREFGVQFGTEIQCDIPDTRDCFSQLWDYLYTDVYDVKRRVCALYGLRRTGKTIMMRQAILRMSDSDKKRAVLVNCRKGGTISQLREILRYLRKNNFQYVFIDEITNVERFSTDASDLADTCCEQFGMRVVIAGTDSLGILLAKQHILYDRIYMIQTSYVSYREFKRLVRVPDGEPVDVDLYVQYGGLLTMEAYKDHQAASEYQNSAIVHNILSALRLAEDDLRFHLPYLTELYDEELLVTVINGMVNLFSQVMVYKTLRRQLSRYKSSPLHNAVHNLDRKALERDFSFENVLELSELDKEIANVLGMVDMSQYDFKKEHLIQVVEYLRLLNLYLRIPVAGLYGAPTTTYIEILTQPGMVYNHIDTAVNVLSAVELGVSDEDKAQLLRVVRTTSLGKVLENVILTDMFKQWATTHYVSKLDAVGHEADMIIMNRETRETLLFEVKHSTKRSSNQVKHLCSKEFNEYVERYFGSVTQRIVLYRGETETVDPKDVVEGVPSVQYVNVEEFLLNSELWVR